MDLVIIVNQICILNLTHTNQHSSSSTIQHTPTSPNQNLPKQSRINQKHLQNYLQSSDGKAGLSKRREDLYSSYQNYKLTEW